METNTPLTDALLAKGCSSKELVEHAQSLERQLAEVRAEGDSWKSLAAKNTGALAFVEVERDSLRSVADGLAGALGGVCHTFELLDEANHPTPCEIPHCVHCASEAALAAYAALTGGKGKEGSE